MCSRHVTYCLSNMGSEILDAALRLYPYEEPAHALRYSRLCLKFALHLLLVRGLKYSGCYLSSYGAGYSGYLPLLIVPKPMWVPISTVPPDQD